MTGAAINPPCELLPWDTNFFGKKIARVTQDRLDAHGFKEISTWAERNSVDCLYLLLPANARQTIDASEHSGFRMVDIRVTLELKRIQISSSLKTPAQTRLANATDIPYLRAIAAVSHHDSRFYSDQHFSRKRCDALYETWIEKAVRNPADAVVVIDEGNRAAGYCSCHLHGAGVGNIGLLALSVSVQGRGFGSALLDGALRWFQEKQCETVTVVTQARNIRALRFYQKAGFLTRSVEVWFHRWFTAN